MIIVTCSPAREFDAGCWRAAPTLSKANRSPARSSRRLRPHDSDWSGASFAAGLHGLVAMRTRRHAKSYILNSLISTHTKVQAKSTANNDRMYSSLATMAVATQLFAIASQSQNISVLLAGGGHFLPNGLTAVCAQPTSTDGGFLRESMHRPGVNYKTQGALKMPLATKEISHVVVRSPYVVVRCKHVSLPSQPCVG